MVNYYADYLHTVGEGQEYLRVQKIIMDYQLIALSGRLKKISEISKDNSITSDLSQTEIKSTE